VVIGISFEILPDNKRHVVYVKVRVCILVREARLTRHVCDEFSSLLHEVPLLLTEKIQTRVLRSSTWTSLVEEEENRKNNKNYYNH
jgi:hypothetical protein